MDVSIFHVFQKVWTDIKQCWYLSQQDFQTLLCTSWVSLHVCKFDCASEFLTHKIAYAEGHNMGMGQAGVCYDHMPTHPILWDM